MKSVLLLVHDDLLDDVDRQAPGDSPVPLVNAHQEDGQMAASGPVPSSSPDGLAPAHAAEWRLPGAVPVSRNVLLPVHEDVGQPARIRKAIDHVRALDGHLFCVEVACMPLIDDDSRDPSLNMMLGNSARTDENCVHVQALLARELIAATWINASGAAAWELASSLADVIVVNRNPDRVRRQA